MPVDVQSSRTTRCRHQSIHEWKECLMVFARKTLRRSQLRDLSQRRHQRDPCLREDFRALLYREDSHPSHVARIHRDEREQRTSRLQHSQRPSQCDRRPSRCGDQLQVPENQSHQRFRYQDLTTCRRPRSRSQDRWTPVQNEVSDLECPP